MAAAKAGDRVIVAKRNPTEEDARTGLYYEYFGGLTGTVDRVYDDHSVCVDIDLDSLEEATRERHHSMQEAEKRRWMDSLAQEARSRLTPEQQQLKMSYKILVSRKDLEPFEGARPVRKNAALPTPKQAASAEPSPKPNVVKQPIEAAAAKPRPKVAEEGPRRLSQADLDAAEEAMLQAQKDRK